jgi:hypothetical protein
MRLWMLVVAGFLVGCGAGGGEGSDAGALDGPPVDTQQQLDLTPLPDTRDSGPADLGQPDSLDQVEVAGDAADSRDIPGQCQDHHDCLYLEKDGNLCDGGWFCEFGTCVERKTPVYCNENTLSAEERRCNTLRCDPEAGVCKKSFKPAGTECDDKNECSSWDTCVEGVCVGEAKECQTTKPCYPAACDPKTGSCVETYLGEGQPCDDLSLCTQNDQCSSGQCQGVAKECPAPPQCRKAQCDEETGECVFLPKGDALPCNDGDKCTQIDLCKQGECQGIPVECLPSGLCMVAACDGETGECAEHPAEVGSPCEDGLFCTQDDSCNADGDCLSGAPRNCGTGEVCRLGECDDTQDKCVITNATPGTPCSDFDLCTVGDNCQAGLCTAAAKNCPVTDARCQRGLCNPYDGNCVVENFTNGTGCNDGNNCTNDSCQNGACVGTQKVCNYSGNQCKKLPYCNASNGACVEDNKNNGTPCNDGNGDTENDNCQNGVCKGTPKD